MSNTVATMVSPSNPNPQNQTQVKLQALESEMNRYFQNRRDEIHGLFVTLMARGNMILLGPAGTAKTATVKMLSRHLNGKFFHTLLSRTSAPEELLGPYSLADLENGKYVRITSNTIVDGDVAFLDEVFKGNSAILNTQLSILADREYRNGTGAPTAIPLLMAVGASNEMPEGGAEGELAALWDRFEMRFVTQYINDERAFVSMLALTGANEPTTVVDVKDVKAAFADVAKVDFTPILPNITNLWKTLRKEGYSVSDRKWRNSLRYLQANAWLDGRAVCTEDDLEVLANMFWQSPEQQKPLRKLVLGFANPLTVKANEVWDSAVEELARIRTLEGKDQSLAATELNAKLTKAKRNLNNWIQEAIDNGKSSAKLKERLEQITELNQVLVKEILLNI